MDPHQALFSDIAFEDITLFYGQEPLFGGLPVLVFYGPSKKGNSTQNSSRVQAHLFSLGGFRSFPRLTIAPTSPLYVAVNHLPHDFQGDEVYRGIAISILRYFSSLSNTTKDLLRDVARQSSPADSGPAMFDEMHAANLATRMTPIVQCGNIVEYLTSAFTTKTLSWIDIDLLLAPNVASHDSTNTHLGSTAGDDPLISSGFGIFESILKQGTVSSAPFTSIQRSPSSAPLPSTTKYLSKGNKISLRKEMCELVDTECNYVSKLQDLFHFATSQKDDSGPHVSRQGYLRQCLGTIVRLNESFYQDVLAILDGSEADALYEIENEDDIASRPEDGPYGSGRDSTGVLPFANAMLKWLPDFKTPYQTYLIESENFKDLASDLSTKSSRITSKVASFIGEQQLKSSLIEPVQRLPRYTLFINNILQLLPTTHVAREPLVKARVILVDICDLGRDKDHGLANSADFLRRAIRNWPQSMRSTGRLASAVDAIELALPFQAKAEGHHCMLILLSGRLVIVHKMNSDAMSSRALVGGASQPSVIGCDTIESGLSFECCLSLKSLWVSESNDGLIIYLSQIPSASMLARETLQLQPRAFYLQAPYHAKASRLAWEIAMSRLHDRYPPASVGQQSESSIRSFRETKDDIGILAIISRSATHRSLQSQYNGGSIRLFLDHSRGASTLMADAAGADIVGHIHLCPDYSCTLRIESSDGTKSEEVCAIEDVMQRFRQILRQLLHSGSLRFHERQAAFDAAILQALPLEQCQGGLQRKGSRPRSPVKLLSTVLGGLNGHLSTPVKTRAHMSTFEWSSQALTSEQKIQDTSKVKGPANGSPIKQVPGMPASQEHVKSSLDLLEATFMAYVMALRSRSGNVVGRTLHARSNTDVLAVNDLYNSLLEDPTRLEAAAVVSVDILFSAFEKFLRVAWRERMGPLLAPTMIQTLQTTFDNKDAKTFRQQFRHCIDEMSPQNRRAFASTLKLLSDLLDASGNDGDRGVLVASFAEALVLTGDPYECVMLFDRLSEDYDTLFEDYPDAVFTTNSTSNSLNKNRSCNQISINSNASSLRKKFGLARSDSKVEPESKVAAIWRTLSKNARSPGETIQTYTGPKPSLARSRSTDMDVRMLPPSRPESRDRPLTAASTISVGFKGARDKPILNTSSPGLTFENMWKQPNISNRKKRRSSLSDLHSLKQVDGGGSSASDLTWQVKDLEVPEQANGVIPPLHLGSERKKSTPPPSRLPRFNSPHLKESSVSRPTSKDMDILTITSHTPSKRGSPMSHLPTPRAGLSERAWPPSNANIPPRPGMKLSPRSAKRDEAIGSYSADKEQENSVPSRPTLQAEMDRIGHELSTLGKSKSTAGFAKRQGQQTQIQKLSERLDSLQKQIESGNSQLKTDTSETTSKLLAAEKKVALLDGLYEEANAENEALYERYNGELSRILNRVKRGQGVDTLRSQLEDAQRHAGRLKSENASLKREIVELKDTK